MNPIWGMGTARDGELAEMLRSELGVSGRILAWDLMVHDLAPSQLCGSRHELISAPRIDNLASCWAVLEALREVPEQPDLGIVACLYDNEEVGSLSATGAASTILATTLERLVLNRGGDREAYHRAIARSACASLDGAHATHPNYPERHDPNHHVTLGGGPVIKVNANARYATTSSTAALLVRACENAGVPHQWFVSRNDIPCGSTVGPITSAQIGVDTVDAGIPQLAMHSARELCGSTDPAWLASALSSFLCA